MKCTNTNSNYVIKSNSLVEARYRLSLQEMHVIYWLLTQIKPEDEEFKTHKLEIVEFANIIGVKSENQYKELRKVTKRLIQRAMEIYQPKTQEYLQFSWLSSARYQIKQGCVLLEFSPLLKPYLLQLKGYFTKIDIVDTLKLKSIYAVRIFELLLQYISIGKREINIEELRSYCGIEKGQYKLYADLKRYIIEKSRLEINKNTEYEICYSEIKESRKVVAIEWTIQKKNFVREKQLEKVKSIEKELRSEAILVESLLEYGVSRPITKRLLKNYGEDVVRNALRAVNLQVERGKAKNPKAMLHTAIQEKWHPEVFRKRKSS